MSNPVEPNKKRWSPARILAWCEFAVVFVVFTWAMAGAVQFAWVTGGTLEGLLGTLDRNWRGALILAALLFYRTLHEVLARVKRVRAPAVEFEEELPIAGKPEWLEK